MLATAEERFMQIQALPPAILKRSKQIEMPVLYREAIAALERCATMDEGKYYADKADALAAWAKIYGSDEDSKAAARLKLKAYARMGQLATELRPNVVGKREKGVGYPGPHSLLHEIGLTKSSARAALKLARVDDSTMGVILDAAKTPCLSVNQLYKAGISSSWEAFGREPPGGGAFLAFCRRHKADELAKGLVGDEIKKSRAIVGELIEWLDAFEQALPK